MPSYGDLVPAYPSETQLLSIASAPTPWLSPTLRLYSDEAASIPATTTVKAWQANDGTLFKSPLTTRTKAAAGVISTSTNSQFMTAVDLAAGVQVEEADMLIAFKLPNGRTGMVDNTNYPIFDSTDSGLMPMFTLGVWTTGATAPAIRIGGDISAGQVPYTSSLTWGSSNNLHIMTISDPTVLSIVRVTWNTSTIVRLYNSAGTLISSHDVTDDLGGIYGYSANAYSDPVAALTTKILAGTSGGINLHSICRVFGRVYSAQELTKYFQQFN